MDIKPVDGKTVKVKLEDLNIRYIPMAKLERWWDGHEHGYNMMSLPTSPHVEIMRIFLKHGFDWKRLKHSRYAEERRYRAKVGMTQWDSSKYMKAHFEKRYAILRSLRRSGYVKKKHGNRPIMILKEPFWNSRFKWNDPLIKGLEIWNGAGRSSAFYALGKKYIPVVYVEDVAPGKMKCKDLERKFKNAKD